MHSPGLLKNIALAFMLIGLTQAHAFASADVTEDVNSPSEREILDEEKSHSRTETDTSLAVRGKLVNGIYMRKSPTGALVRSIIIPGWGQFYTKHWIKSIVYFGTDVSFIYGAFVQNGLYNDFLDKANASKTDSDKAFYEKSANFYRDDRNKLIWWTVGLTSLAAFDALVEAHLYDFRIDPTLSASAPGKPLQMGLSITF